MTNAELLAKIKAEIERRWKDYRNSVTPDQPKYRTHYFVGKGEVCEELLSFLDTLESEHFADARKISPKDLEEAAEEYRKGVCEHPMYYTYTKQCFIAGAKWQKEQMMKKAIKGEVIIYDGLWQIHTPDLDTVLRKMDEGDKVRIIIVKED